MKSLDIYQMIRVNLGWLNVDNLKFYKNMSDADKDELKKFIISFASNIASMAVQEFERAFENGKGKSKEFLTEILKKGENK